MRKSLVVAILIATAACGAYHFPGPGSNIGHVKGHVLALGCGGPAQPDAGACLEKPTAECLPQPAGPSCGGSPMPGFELVFASGATKLITKSESGGVYSIDLPAGTWRVSAGRYGRIIDGPQTLVVSAGASIIADYFVDTGIRAAA